MMFIAIKTEDGMIKGKLSFYCRMLGVSRQGFYKYLAHKDRPWKYQDLADAMRAINTEDECNDTYGRIRMYQALLLKKPEGLKIPSERTVYRVMDEIGLSHQPKRKPNGITKADREARKSIPYASLPADMIDTITIDLDGMAVGTVVMVKDIPELMSDAIELRVDPEEIVLRISDKTYQDSQAETDGSEET